MDPKALAKLIDSVPALLATRYLTCACSKSVLRHGSISVADGLFPVIGLVVLLWDHVLTFEEEIKYIWKLPVELGKVVFLFNRYFVEGALCLSAYGELGEISERAKDLTPTDTVLLELRGPLSQEVRLASFPCKNLQFLTPPRRCTSGGRAWTSQTSEPLPDVTTTYCSWRALQSLA